MKIVKNKLQLDAATNLDVSRIQTQLDLVQVQAIAARNQLDNDRATLSMLTNGPVEALAKLKQTIPLVKPHPEHLQNWLVTANQYNIALQSTRFRLAAAKENIKIEEAKGMPTLYAVGTYSKSREVTPVFGTGHFQNMGGGVQLDIPLFAGGGIDAKARQAAKNYLAERENFNYAHNQMSLGVQTTFSNLFILIQKIKADKTALSSADQTLQASNHAYDAGSSDIETVILAEQTKTQAESAYRQDLYDYVLSILELKKLAGTLNEQDLIAISRYLSA